jgi:hypothetical protein
VTLASPNLTDGWPDAPSGGNHRAAVRITWDLDKQFQAAYRVYGSIRGNLTQIGGSAVPYALLTNREGIGLYLERIQFGYADMIYFSGYIFTPYQKVASPDLGVQVHAIGVDGSAVPSQLKIGDGAQQFKYKIRYKGDDSTMQLIRQVSVTRSSEDSTTTYEEAVPSADSGADLEDTFGDIPILPDTTKVAVWYVLKRGDEEVASSERFEYTSFVSPPSILTRRGRDRGHLCARADRQS